MKEREFAVVQMQPCGCLKYFTVYVILLKTGDSVQNNISLREISIYKLNLSKKVALLAIFYFSAFTQLEKC